MRIYLKEELAERHLLASEERAACRCDWGGVALGGRDDHHNDNDDDGDDHQNDDGDDDISNK